MIDKIADAVIVHAHVFKKWLREQGIKHCYVIPHGIEVVRGTPSNCSGEHKLILCFGVISPRKGINNLILAFSKIKDELPNYKLIIAGGEPIYYNKYLNTLKFLVRKQGIEDRVIFTGRVEEDDIGNLFNKASFVVIPYPFSTSASGPLAMAMGFGKPIIVTSTEYFSEVLEDGKDALLVPPEDSEGLANAILRLSKDEALRKDLSYHVRSKAKKYRWGEIAEMTYDVYNNILWGRKV